MFGAPTQVNMNPLIRATLLTFATLVPLFLLARAVDVVAVRSAMGQTVPSPDGTTTVPFQNFIPPIVCCVTIPAKGGDIVLDLDKGTIDLGGAKLDDGARAFWDAVRKIAGRDATAQSPDDTMTGPSNLCVGVHDCHMQAHAYTLDDIDRMRAAVSREITTPTGTYLCHSNVMWTDDNGVAFAQLQDGTNVPCELKK